METRRPTERNAVDMPESAAAVESWREMRSGCESRGAAGGHNPNRAARVKRSCAREQADVWQSCRGAIH
jgi:hypothetical protein